MSENKSKQGKRRGEIMPLRFFITVTVIASEAKQSPRTNKELT